MKPQQPTKYLAGYGLLKSRNFVEALLHRKLRPTETITKLPGYELRIVPQRELSGLAQIAEFPAFRLYGLRTTGNLEDKISVRLLELNKAEYALVRAVDFEDAVFKPEQVAELDSIPYFAHVLEDPTLGQAIPVEERLNYRPYLNGGIDDAVAIAREIRKRWLLTYTPEGAPRRGPEKG
jgi:hypothetical protein